MKNGKALTVFIVLTMVFTSVSMASAATIDDVNYISSEKLETETSIGVPEATAPQDEETEVSTSTKVRSVSKSYTTTIPKKTSISSITRYGFRGIKIQWKTSVGADKYEVYRSTSKYGEYKLLKRVSNTVNVYYSDHLVKNKRYFYKVKAINKNGVGEFSYVRSITVSGLSHKDGLDIVDFSDYTYSYINMKNDIDALCRKYPDKLSNQIVGTTADNRNIYCLVLGNPNAKKQVVVTASMHAREWRNSQVVMMMVEKYCLHPNRTYNGRKYKDLLNNVCFYIFPMVNPDGVTISQYGPSGLNSSTIRTKVRNMPRKGGYSNWKSNARGVDLNHNYTIYGTKASPRHPASDGYNGYKPFSEAETKAIKKVMDSLKNIKAVINYHQMGRVIYYGYESAQKSKAVGFASMMKSMSGYRLINENHDPTHGDMEHYILHHYEKPYVCMETGTTVPCPLSQLNTIYNQIHLSFAKTANRYS